MGSDEIIVPLRRIVGTRRLGRKAQSPSASRTFAPFHRLPESGAAGSLDPRCRLPPESDPPRKRDTVSSLGIAVELPTGPANLKPLSALSATDRAGAASAWLVAEYPRRP